MAVTTMKACVIYTGGKPETLQIEDRPIPTASEGQVLIRVRARGLNRSEMFTRQGLSPGVKFPRILGIEAVGTVADAPGGEFEKGVIVATAMGGIGRSSEGSYAEYLLVPAKYVKVMETKLDWTILGAIPEMLQTAYGSLFSALQLKKGERLLVRGGTTSVGLAAAAIAKNHGCIVASTTRRVDRTELLHKSGAEKVFIDNGNIAKDVQEWGGADKILELIGTTTLKDSLQCARKHGAVCMTGMVGDKWSFDDFSPMDSIPSTVGLTVYDGGSTEWMETPLTELCKQIEEGTLPVTVGKVFQLEDMVEAHRCMEENKAGGKIVVLS